MFIRQAVPNDTPEIASLFFNCLQISYAGVLSEEVRRTVDLEYSLQLWSNALGSNPDRQTFVALEEDQLVGFYRIGPENEKSSMGHLFSLYISPKFGGQGIGSKLLLKALHGLEARGFSEISLWVFADNKAAIGLYRKFGFDMANDCRTSDVWKALEVKMLRTKT